MMIGSHAWSTGGEAAEERGSRVLLVVPSQTSLRSALSPRAKSRFPKARARPPQLLESTTAGPSPPQEARVLHLTHAPTMQQSIGVLWRSGDSCRTPPRRRRPGCNVQLTYYASFAPIFLATTDLRLRERGGRNCRRAGFPD